jgi:hypothetical protein
MIWKAFSPGAAFSPGDTSNVEEGDLKKLANAHNVMWISEPGLSHANTHRSYTTGKQAS